MKKIALILSSLLAALATFNARANEINTSAKQAILVDYDSGAVLFEKDSDQLMEPSSMTKLMTIEIVFSLLKSGDLALDDTFLVSEKAWRTPRDESRMFVEVGDSIRLEDLIRGIVVQSGNDACTVIAEGLEGTEDNFAQRMTERAIELGMADSIFMNASGRPHVEHLTTAADLAILSAHIIREYPEYYPYFKETEFTWNDIKQDNRNPLLYIDTSADGLKTGSTSRAGYGLVGSAERKGRRYILVINGLENSKQRRSESKRLLDMAFRDYKAYALLQPDQLVERARVWNGVKTRVKLTVKEPLTVMMRRQSRRKMTVTVNYNGPLPAPVLANTEVGTLTVSAPGFVPVSMPVYTAEDVAHVGLFGQMGAALQYLLLGELKI